MRQIASLFLLCSLSVIGCEKESPPNMPSSSSTDAAAVLCTSSADCAAGYECSYGICVLPSPDSGPQIIPDAGMTQGQIKSDKESLDFGAVTFGTTTVRQVIVSNIGDGPLKLLEMLVNNDPLDEFEALIGETLPTTLEPGQQVGIMVGYTPRDSTDDNAKLVFVSDDADMVLLEIPMNSEFKGLAEFTIVEDASSSEPQVLQLNFGAVPLFANRQKTLYIKNLGSGANPLLAILDSRLDPSPSNHFSLSTSTTTPAYLNKFKSEALCSASMPCPSNHTCDQAGICRPLIELFELTVTFEPQSLGTINERLVITSKKGGTSNQQDAHIIEIMGEGTEAQLFVDPESIDFGNVFVGTIASQSVTLSNTGGADLSINQVRLSGGNTDLQLDLSGQTLPIIIGASQSTTIDVRYQPTQAEVISEQLTIESSDPQMPMYQLTITATSALAPLVGAPSSVDFGQTHIIPASATSPQRTVTITNTGGSDLVVSSVEWGPSASSAFTTMPTNLAPIAPGQQSSFPVLYSPRTVGTDTAQLILITNDPNQNRVQIDFSGQAIDPNITVTPTGSIDLGSVLPGASSPIVNLEISNTGVGPLVLSTIAFTSGSSPDFSLNVSSSLPQILNPSQILSFSVLYQPTTVGPDTAAIQIDSSDLDAPSVNINLYGRGSDCPANTWDLDGDPNNGCEYTCVIASPPVEICNQQDDDCDGATDEGFQVGASCTGQGECGSGLIECNASNPSLSTCSTNPGQSQDQSQAETCDGRDEDCDGINDNGFDLAQSLLHCGLCNNTCTVTDGTPECVGGVCRVLSCDPGFLDCDGIALTGCEVDSRSNINHCSACNSVCALPNASPACNNSQCEISQCDSGFSDCDGTASNGCEVETDVSINNCGACGRSCNIPNGSPICQNGSCEIGACDPGYGDCDGVVSNGCEQDLNTLSHCGACNQACMAQNATTSCSSGTCQIGACDPGFGDCDSSVLNGCETPITTPTNCGACGTSCGVNSLCCAQSCRAASSQDCGACGNTCSQGLLMVTEAMINPDAVIDQQGEWLEIYNTSTISIDIRGFRLSDMGSDSHIITSAVPVIVPPQSFLVLGRNANESTNGGVRIGYQYASYTLGNSGDEIILSAFGTDLDSISYPSNFDQAGISKQKTQSQLDTVDSNGSTLWCASTSTMAGGDLGTPGYENLICP